ncbi:YraN family protein [Criibacterium bergeronii]|uniref:UPF0102 protein BBG48_003680 n=1 Tax=Criibacterium bergeronii TaxID=1871336 RepID=A0A371IMG5_9FIRM|nr:YraN family protein [Criibacterium bergeronii]MBS6062345.1 YraN family protein [Peptostreptococcaceae bacterium]RDY21693.1 YraN family protein [Criibacterium bergeronii]
MKNLNTQKGKQGEELACNYLLKNGYKIITRNYKTKFAEIDIIAYKAKIISFVEVKSRSSVDYGRGYEAVDNRKMNKIRTNANYYLCTSDVDYEGLSFDIIEVDLKSGAVNHIVSAF